MIFCRYWKIQLLLINLYSNNDQTIPNPSVKVLLAICRWWYVTILYLVQPQFQTSKPPMWYQILLTIVYWQNCSFILLNNEYHIIELNNSLDIHFMRTDFIVVSIIVVDMSLNEIFQRTLAVLFWEVHHSHFA